MSKGKQPRTSV